MASDYCTRAQLRSYLGLKTAATEDDELLDALITRSSRAIDRYTRRWFYELTDTREYDDPPGKYVLFLDADLLSLTTLTIDGSETTNYKLRPHNRTPYQWVEITYGSGDRFVWTNTPQDSVSVEGEWGWHDDYGNAWVTSGDTVQNTTEITAAGTTLEVADGANFAVRQTLKIADEQLLVTAISSQNLTVTRGINGTTAAVHANGTAISIYEPPADIVEQTVRMAAWYYRRKDTMFGETATPSLGVVQKPLAIPPDVKATLDTYKRRRV